MVKRCAWGTCKSDSRYPTRLQKDDGTSVSFYSFPSLKKSRERREIWIRPCCRGDAFVCLKDSYICGFHFIGEMDQQRNILIRYPLQQMQIKYVVPLKFCGYLHHNFPTHTCSAYRSVFIFILYTSRSSGYNENESHQSIVISIL